MTHTVYERFDRLTPIDENQKFYERPCFTFLWFTVYMSVTVYLQTDPKRIHTDFLQLSDKSISRIALLQIFNISCKPLTVADNNNNNNNNNNNDTYTAHFSKRLKCV